VFDITWKISVGKYRLSMLESVEVIRSVEQLSDRATIVLPGSVFNQAIEVESKIKRGDAVKVEFGYDDNTLVEFEGFLESISTDDGSIKLNCEDGIYSFRKAVADKEFKNPDVKDILSYACSQVGGYSLQCDYSFTYDKFIARGNTAYDLLKRIQEECKANIYLKGNVLHVHPQYSEIFGTSKYSFQVNIEKSELEYKNAEDRIMEVIVEGKGRDGKVVRATAGKKGGDQVTLKMDGVSDLGSLQKVADEQLKTKSYSGYSGSFAAWLIPYTDAGYKVTILDEDYTEKNGDYYVLEVSTHLSSSGGVRTIKLGARI